MDPITIGMLAAPIIGGLFGAAGQHSANQESRSSVREQMRFQERMSNSAYQRSMKDMRKAGLNPILAYKQGGAGTPSGGSYTAGNVGAAAVAGASSAQSTYRSSRETQPAVEQAWANVDLTNAEARNKFYQRELLKAQASQAATASAKNLADTAILREDLQVAKAASEAARTDVEFYKSKPGQFLRNVERVSRSILPGASSAKALSGGR